MNFIATPSAKASLEDRLAIAVPVLTRYVEAKQAKRNPKRPIVTFKDFVTAYGAELSFGQVRGVCRWLGVKEPSQDLPAVFKAFNDIEAIVAKKKLSVTDVLSARLSAS